MSEIRLSQAAKQLNVSTKTILDILSEKGIASGLRPNSKISTDQFNLLKKEFAESIELKEKASEMTIGSKTDNVVIKSRSEKKEEKEQTDGEEEERILVKNLNAEPVKKEVKEDVKEEKTIEKAQTGLKGLTVKGKIDLDATKKKVAKKKTETKTIKVKKEPIVKKEEPVVKKVIKEEEPVAKTEAKKETIKPKVESKKEIEKVAKKEVQVTQPKDKEVKKVEAKKLILEEKIVVEKKDKKVEPELKTKIKKEEPVSEKTKKEVKQKEVKIEKTKIEETKEVKSEEKEQKVEKVVSSETTTPKDKKVDETTTTTSEIKSEEQKSDEKVVSSENKEEEGVIKAQGKEELRGLKVVGKIDLSSFQKKPKPVASSDKKSSNRRRRKRKRVPADGSSNRNNRTTTGGTASGAKNPNTTAGGSNTKSSTSSSGGGRTSSNTGRRVKKAAPSAKEIESNVKNTLARMGNRGNAKNATRKKSRKDRRLAHAKAEEERLQKQRDDAQKLKVTEFITTSQLASLMNVAVIEVISKALKMGSMININQRLDPDVIEMVALEFGYEAELMRDDEEVQVIEEEEDKKEDLITRPPIVTIMGHVDHGKTTLLDYIRETKVASGEAGGITQHIGAYKVQTNSGQEVAFLDTPGHEAFTAMRARGAKVTDIVVIVIAADDGVMPRTKEAISHAQAADVPIIIAINKMDRPNANPERIKQELSEMNLLVEDWGGKYQCQEISAKTGAGVDDLLERVLLEAEVLELTANPNKRAVGTVVEATLDKGRGYVTTVLIQAGTLRVGDVMLGGSHHGKVKAMTNHRGINLKEAGPSTPVQILGLDGAPKAGDKFNVMVNDREAREIANKRGQRLREQSIRATRRVTLNDLHHRMSVGNFQQLNIVLKGDVDGSVEALSDSLLKLSNEEVEINIIHKAVGQISQSDILLAASSNAIVIGFQVRPSRQSREVAEKENVEIRLYSVIYKAIEELKDAIEGMLSPEQEEIITGTIDIRDTFKISKVGTIAGAYVTSGKVNRHAQIRLVRDGIVVYTGEIDTLKRFKDDVTEVKNNFECGFTIKNFNDIKVGDEVEVFEIKETKRTLASLKASTAEKAAAEKK